MHRHTFLGNWTCDSTVSWTGLDYCAAGIVVEDARAAFKVAVDNGGIAVHPPTALRDDNGQETVMAEVSMYGDVVMRFMSGALQVSQAEYDCLFWHP